MRMLLLLLLLLGLAGCTTPENGVVCTMEAKACPDGSSVGRNPEKNCEFDPCPSGPK
jgi:hypothetical protein